MGCINSTSAVDSPPDGTKAKAKGADEGSQRNESSDNFSIAQSDPSSSNSRAVSAREARGANALLEQHCDVFRQIKMLRVGQALKDAFGKNWNSNLDPHNPDDVIRSARLLAQLRDSSGILRSDGSFLQEAFGLVPRPAQLAVASSSRQAPKIPEDEAAFVAPMEYTRTVALSCGMHLPTATLWLTRMMDAADCVLVSATMGCELHASPRSSVTADSDDDLRSGTLALAVKKSVKQLFSTGRTNLWSDVTAAVNADPDDVMRVFQEPFEDTILPSLTKPTLVRANAVRSAVRTAHSVLLFFHGGRRYSAPIVKTDNRTHIAAIHSRGLSRIVERFWDYCAHPQNGMELSRKVEESGQALCCYLAFLGAIPAKQDALESLAITGTYLAGPLLSPAANGIILYMLAIVQTQLRLDLKELHRSDILHEVATLIGRSVVARAAREREPVSSKVFPTFAGEAGEGHGPRKEFFDQCARALCSPTSAPHATRGLAWADAAEGSSLMALRPASPEALKELQRLLVVGNVIEVALPGDNKTFTAKIFSVRLRDDELALRLGTMIPTDLDGAPLVSVSKVQFQAFAPPSNDAAFVWFNGSVSDEIDDDAYALYFVAGWLLGAAVANGVAIPLPVPPVLLKLMRQKMLGLKPEASEADLVELDPSYAGTLHTLRSLDAAGFNGYAASLLEDEDTKALPTARAATLEVVREKFIADHLVREMLVKRCSRRLAATTDGYSASMVPLLAAAWAVPTDIMHAMICGTPDTVNTDFSFFEWFNINFAPDFKSTVHGRVFMDAIRNALDGVGIPNAAARTTFKRRLLQFITGRELLPARKLSETITVEYGEFAETTIEHAAQLGRLPSAHTCTNALQVPNYLEALAFGGSDQACKTITGSPVSERSIVVTKDMKHNGWSRLEPSVQNMLLTHARQLLLERLTQASFGADSYELDAGARSDDGMDEDAAGSSSRPGSRSVPVPRRLNTVPPDQLRLAAMAMHDRVPGNTPSSSASTNPRQIIRFNVDVPSNQSRSFDEDHDDEEPQEFEMPMEDTPQEDTVATNPFMPLTDHGEDLPAPLPRKPPTTSPKGSVLVVVTPARIDFSKPDLVVNAADFEDDSEDDTDVGPPMMREATPPPRFVAHHANDRQLPGAVMHDFDS
jgi:hypothetical protein